MFPLPGSGEDRSWKIKTNRLNRHFSASDVHELNWLFMNLGLRRPMPAKEALLRKSKWRVVCNIWLAMVAVRHRKGERMVCTCVVPTAKHGGGGVMMWDCIAGKPSRSVRECIQCVKLTTKQKEGTWNNRIYFLKEYSVCLALFYFLHEIL